MIEMAAIAAEIVRAAAGKGPAGPFPEFQRDSESAHLKEN